MFTIQNVFSFSYLIGRSEEVFTARLPQNDDKNYKLSELAEIITVSYDEKKTTAKEQTELTDLSRRIYI